MLVFCMAASAPGCSKQAADDSKNENTAEAAEESFDMTPHAKDDGTKYRLAYVDYDEYLQASRQLYYIIAGLEELGWISKGSIPFNITDIDSKEMSSKEMYAALEKADLGPYVEFADGAHYYLAYEDNDEVSDSIVSRAGKDIDLVIASGTSAGLFVKDLHLDIPMVDFSATDPVASGIIDSTENSGDPKVWANVEPSVPLRQLKYYYSLKPFKRAGLIVYGDETISGVPDIEKSAEELGFELVKYNIEEQPRETDEELAAYYDLVESNFKKMAKEDIDAFFMTVDLVNEPDKLPRMFEHLYKEKIPVFCLDDADTIRNGGLLLILANDLENQGRFIADAMVKILNGADASTLPCVYTSAPSIYVNYSVAQRIGYPLKFEFLTICDEIVTEDSDD